MKKALPIIIVLILLLVGGFFFISKSKSSGGVLPTPTPKQKEITNVPLEDKPFVSLIPRADGKELIMNISGIKAGSKSIEYELVYLSLGDISRGVIGTINLQSGDTEINRKLLLGTCSKNVCRYDEGVEQGNLTLRIRRADGVIKLVSDFHLQKGKGELTSLDGKFKFTGKLSSSTYYVTMQTIGLPKPIEGAVASDIYGVFTYGSTIVKNGSIFLELADNATGKLMYYSGKGWGEVKGFAGGKAFFNNLGVFVVVR